MKKMEDTIRALKHINENDAGILRNDDNSLKSINANKFIKAFLEKHHLRLRRFKGRKEKSRYYHYSEKNCWEYIEFDEDLYSLLRNFLHNYAPDTWSGRYRNACMEILPIECEKVAGNDTKYINVKNGLFNIETFELEDHRPDVFCTTQIPINYDPDAKCPKFRKYLREVLQSNKQLRMVVQEVMGYALSNTTKAEKFVFFIGTSGSGKSTLGKLIRILGGGEENVSSLSLSDFGEKFTLSDLVDKNLNISFETNSYKPKDIENLKAVTTGDVTRVEAKYRDAFSYMHTAKLIFCLNNSPEIHDESDAFIRRLLPIPFNAKFVSGKPMNKNQKSKDPNLLETLEKEELDGIFAFAIRGLKRLVKQEYVFTSCKVITRKLNDYKHEINPMSLFIESCVMSVERTEMWDKHRVHADILYYTYKMWEADKNDFGLDFSQQKHEIKAEKTKILKSIRNTLESVPIDYKRKESDGSTYYCGIALTDTGKSLAQQCPVKRVRELVKKTRAGVVVGK